MQNQLSDTQSGGLCQIPTTTSAASCRSPISSAIVTGHGTVVWCQRYEHAQLDGESIVGSRRKSRVSAQDD
jgi:hypothetical protein